MIALEVIWVNLMANAYLTGVSILPPAPLPGRRVEPTSRREIVDYGDNIGIKTYCVSSKESSH